MSKIKVLLLCFLSCSLLMAADDNFCSPESIVDAMNQSLKRANKFRFLTLEFIEILGDTLIAEKENNLREYESKKQQIQARIDENKVVIKEKLHENQCNKSQLAEITTKIENLNKIKLENFKNRRHKKFVDFNKEEYEQLIEIQSLTENSINMFKSLIASYLSEIKFLEQELKSLSLQKITPTTNLISPQGCMPILSIFDSTLDEEKLLVIVKSIPDGLFLTPDYFTSLDDELLNQQAHYAKAVLELIIKTLSIDDVPKGVTEKHIKDFKSFIKEIWVILEYEKIRRAIKTETILEIHSKLNAIFSEAQIHMNDLINLGKTASEFVKLLEKSIITQENFKKWEVLVHKRVRESVSNDQEQEKLNDLKKHLQTKYSISKEEEIANGWSNFSSLSKNDYHCHLGNSNRVLVWKVLQKEHQIIIYYLGGHPNNYRAITKKADIL